MKRTGKNRDALKLFQYMRFLYQMYRIAQTGDNLQGISNLIEGFKLRKEVAMNSVIGTELYPALLVSVCVELREASKNQMEMIFLRREFGPFMEWLESSSQEKGEGIDNPKS